MTFAVNTIYRATDQVSSVFKKMGNSAGMFAKNTRESFKQARKSANEMKSVFGGVLGANLVSQGVGKLTQGLGGLAGEIVAFDSSITSAAAKFPTMIQRGTQGFEDISKAARDAGGTTEFTSSQAALGLKEMAKAGFTADKAISGLVPLLNMATASELDLVTASKVTTKALGAFELNVDDPVQLSKNINLVSDTFSKLANSATTDVDMIFDAMRRSGPVVAGAGGSIHDFAAMVGVLADSSIDASVAGTSINKVILRLAKPTAEARRQLKKLKLDYKKLGGPDILKDLNTLKQAMSKLTEKQKTKAAAAIFGVEGISGVKVLIRDAGTRLDEFKQKMVDAGGSTEKSAELIRTSMGNKLAVLKSSLIDVGFRVVETFMDKIPGGIDGATEAIRKFDVTPIVKGIIGIGKALIGMHKFIKENGPMIKAFFVGFIALKTLSGVASIISGIGSALVLFTNPIGLIAVGIAGLIAAFTVFKDHPIVEYLKHSFTPVLESIKDLGVLLEQTWRDLTSESSGLFSALKPVAIEIGNIGVAILSIGFTMFIDSLKLVIEILGATATAFTIFSKLVGEGFAMAIESDAKRFERFNKAYERFQMLTGTFKARMATTRTGREIAQLTSGQAARITPAMREKFNLPTAAEYNEFKRSIFNPAREQTVYEPPPPQSVFAPRDEYKPGVTPIDINVTVTGNGVQAEAVATVAGAPGINMAKSGKAQE